MMGIVVFQECALCNSCSAYLGQYFAREDFIATHSRVGEVSRQKYGGKSLAR
jgi:hypothetical protein